MEILAKKLGELLKQRGYKLVTAESCTGGGLAQVVTAIAGSSRWFERGFVTYSNASKQELL
ncbi:MAG TPA: CinA family protein, partial [Gammaproteobacteria bacterium]|nr:CinA family protein [Gammaproteobacteria bacterium]